MLCLKPGNPVSFNGLGNKLDAWAASEYQIIKNMNPYFHSRVLLCTVYSSDVTFSCRPGVNDPQVQVCSNRAATQYDNNFHTPNQSKTNLGSSVYLHLHLMQILPPHFYFYLILILFVPDAPPTTFTCITSDALIHISTLDSLYTCRNKLFGLFGCTSHLETITF